ncbi:MAG: glycosyltransferase family 2 protein [Patescibacteria group bacterium]
MLDLSIVIIGYKSRGLVKNCLNSIYANLASSKLNYKIVIVENASNDGTIELVHEKYPQVKLIALNKNSGYSKAVNLGIRTFEAKYYFVLNPDTLFTQEKSIDNLYNFMELNPEIGLAGPKLVNPDGSTQMSCCKFPLFLVPIYRRTKLGKIKQIANKIDDYLMKNWDHQQTCFVDWVIGTGMFVRHQALEKVGLMDERFFMYFEDTDWCRRFWEAGWRVCYLANVEVIHYHGRPSLKHGGIVDLFFNQSTRVHIASWLKYFMKYRSKEKPQIPSSENIKQI